VRIATWNVNGLRARLDFVKLWLVDREPDLVALQELKLTEDQFPHDDFAELGYRATVHGQKAWNGVAVLHRDDAALVQAGLPGQEEFGARFLTVRVGQLAFASVYCPNGKNLDHDDYPRKLAWFDDLARHLGACHETGESLVVGGDYNICPAALDSWNEEQLAGNIFHTDAERQRMQRLYEWGLRDVFRELHPETQAFSWWDYRGGAFHRKHGLRIDFLLATPPVLSRVRAVEIDRDFRKKKDGLTPSDHAPVFADLE
jgi:exodeoxyribonuclease-3